MLDPWRNYDAWRTESDIDQADRLRALYSHGDDEDEEWEREREEQRLTREEQREVLRNDGRNEEAEA